MKSRAPKPRTRQALWSVKQEKPELFEQHEKNLQERLKVDKEGKGPPGFEPCAYDGWLHNQGQNSYLEKATGRLCWLDTDADDFVDLREGEELPISFVGGAASCVGKVAAAAGADEAAHAKVLHVVIPDLHRVAQALKVDLGHFDRPAAMVALFGTCARPVVGVAADVVARAFHERLIKRLGRFRGAWQDDALCGAVCGTLEDISAAEGKHISAAVAVVVGDRLVAHARGGCRFCVSGGVEQQLPEGLPPSTALQRLTRQSPEVSAVLLSEHTLAGAEAADRSALPDATALEAAGPRLLKGRPRAASVAVLRTAQAGGLEGRLAAASLRVVATVAAPETEPPLKRQKTAPAPTKVRVRQIVLLHWRGTGAKPVDPIRRKPVARSPEEAEAQLLRLLDGLVADSGAGFSAACKASSECQSALKGGDMIGDLGWLDRAAPESAAAKPQNPSAAVKSVVPPAVRKAAFELEVGELSDLVVSERGVHLLLRTA